LVNAFLEGTVTLALRHHLRPLSWYFPLSEFKMVANAISSSGSGFGLKCRLFTSTFLWESGFVDICQHAIGDFSLDRSDYKATSRRKSSKSNNHFRMEKHPMTKTANWHISSQNVEIMHNYDADDFWWQFQFPAVWLTQNFKTKWAYIHGIWQPCSTFGGVPSTQNQNEVSSSDTEI